MPHSVGDKAALFSESPPLCEMATLVLELDGKEEHVADKSAAEKARVKPGTKIAVVNPVEGVVEALGLPDPALVETSEAEIVLLFASSPPDLERGLPAVVAGLAHGAVVWVLFRKGSKAAGRTVNRDDVWAAAEPLGMRPLGLVGVDAIWSAFRLKPRA